MKQEKFNLVMNSMRERINECTKYLGEVHTTKDLENLTLGQARDLRNFCVSEVEVMTKIVMVDLYHIIGMGRLTPPQMMQFVFAVQEYLSFRPNIKNLSKHLNNFDELPKLPTKTKFKLLALCDLTLVSELVDSEEDLTDIDESTVEDYHKLKEEADSKTVINEDPISNDESIDESISEDPTEAVLPVGKDPAGGMFEILTSREIRVTERYISKFLKALYPNLKPAANLGTLLTKSATGKTYFGIQWNQRMIDGKLYFFGNCTNDAIFRINKIFF